MLVLKLKFHHCVDERAMWGFLFLPPLSLPDQQLVSPKREILSIAYTALFDRVPFMILYHACFPYLVGQDWVFLSRTRWG